MTLETKEITGKIKWIGEVKQFNGQDVLGFTMTNVEGFLNIYKPKEELEKYINTLKKGYEVSVQVSLGNIVESLTIVSDKVEETKKFIPRPTEDPKQKVAGMIISYVKDLIVANKVDLTNFETEAKRLLKLHNELSK